MEKSVKPDKKYLTKGIWILFTITGIILLSVAITHLIIYLSGGDREAVSIIWITCIGAIIFIWIIAYPIIYFWIINLKYIIYTDRVTIHKGIITKTQQNIPFRAITDFALIRTLYDRILGIGSIKIQTAGQSTKGVSQYEGSLSGLLDYETLHTELRNKIKSLHPAAESVATVEPVRPSDDSVFHEILKELKEIRQNIERLQ